jgi:hypothetical protein
MSPVGAAALTAARPVSGQGQDHPTARLFDFSLGVTPQRRSESSDARTKCSATLIEHG